MPLPLPSLSLLSCRHHPAVAVGRRSSFTSASSTQRRRHSIVGKNNNNNNNNSNSIGATGSYRGASSFGAHHTKHRKYRARVRRGAGATRACWSLEVSVATSAFVVGTLATLLRRGDRRSRGHALFLAVFGSMQVVDTVLWWSEIHGPGGGGGGLATCDLTNRVATRAGLAIICLEPMAAMLGTHLIAGRRPHPLVLAAYSAIFILTPLAGTSLLSDKPPCGVDRLPTSVMSPVALSSSSSAAAAATAAASASSASLDVSSLIEGAATFPSTQIGSRPRWQLRGTSPDHPPAGLAEVPRGAASTRGGPLWANSQERSTTVALPVASGPEGLGTCTALGPSWFDILMRIDDACVCSTVTPQGHLQYGGLDLVYHRALAPWDNPAPCRLGNGEVIVGSREIPLALRAMFLAAMAVPYGWLVKPASCGASHAVILAVTWLVGSSTDAAASMWCLANVGQGLLMLAEPTLWPDEYGHRLLATAASTDKSSTFHGVKNGYSSSPPSLSLSPSSSSSFSFSSSSTSRGIAGRRWPRFNPAAAAAIESSGGADVVIIGSGVGGLALAALLTKAGKKVVVLESHYRAGGCTHAFSEVGDRGDVFDTGIHYVGMGAVLRRLLSHVSAPGAPMRFAAMGSPADGYTYDEIDLGRVAAPAHAPPPPEKQDQSQGQASADQGGGHHSRHARGPTGYGTSFDLDCEEEESYDDEEEEAAAAPVFTVHEVAAEAGDEDHLTEGDRRVVVKLRKGALVESLVESFPEERDGIEAYVAAVRSGGFGPGGSRRVLSGLNGLMVAKFVPLEWGWPGAALRRWLLRRTEVDARDTASEVVARYTDDPALRAVLTAGQMIDWNLPPDEVAWVVAAGMMNYYEDGGYYPVGGSAQIAESMAGLIESGGGRVLCNAPVEGVVVDPASGSATGVRLKGGAEVAAPVVVSACGWCTTFERLIPREALAAAGLDPTEVTHTLRQSHGHVCAYVSMDLPSIELGLRPANIHSFPDQLGAQRAAGAPPGAGAAGAADGYEYDVGGFSRDYYRDPLDGACREPLVTITCPSAKDPWYAEEHPGRANALLLVEGLPEWFDDFKDEAWGRRSEEYETLKQRFEGLFMERLYRYYPKARGHVTHVELSTPLTAQHFINAPGGASYGLEWTPAHFDAALQEKYFNPVVQGIPGLYLTGEAIAFGGFYGALANGFVTASHILGLPRLAAMLLWDDKAEPPEVYEDGVQPPPPPPQQPARNGTQRGSRGAMVEDEATGGGVFDLPLE